MGQTTRVAAKDQDVFAALTFEFGNLGVRVRAADDASVVMPRFRLLWCQAI